MEDLRNRATFKFTNGVVVGSYPHSYFALGLSGGWFGKRIYAVGEAMGVAVSDEAFNAPPRGNRREAVAGPRKMDSGLRVTARYRALPNTSVVRVLVRIQNPHRRAVRTRVAYAGYLAGGGQIVLVEETSSGDQNFTRKDRWVIASHQLHRDDTRRLPIVTQVFSGPFRNARSAPTAVRGYHASESLSSDFGVEMGVQIPGRGTRYMLSYLAVNRLVTQAGREVKLFDRRRPAARFLAGLPTRVKKRIVNWDL